MKKKILIAIVTLFCLILVAGISVFFYIQTDHARNIALNRVNRIIPGSAGLNRFKLSLTGSSVALEGFTLLDRSGAKCLEIQSLFIDIRLSALLNKTLEIVDFRLDHPRILMTRDADGRINLLDAVLPEVSQPPKEKKESKTVGLPLNIVLADAAINNGFFSLSDPKNQVTVGDIDIELIHADFKKQQLVMDTRINQTKLLLDSRPVRIDDVHIHTDLKPAGQMTFRLEVGSDILDLTGKGEVRQLFKAPEIDINLNANARLDALQSLLKDQVRLKGTADLSFSGMGPVSNPEAEVRFKVDNLCINEDLEQGSIQLAFSLDDRSLTLYPGELELLGSRISVSGKADLAPMFPDGFLSPSAGPEHISYTFSFDQQNGNFNRLTRWIKGFTGHFSTQGHIKGQGINPDTLSLDSRLTFDLDNFKQESAANRPIDLQTSFAGKLEKGLVNVELLKMVSGDAVVNAEGRYSLKNQKIKASLSARGDNINPVAFSEKLGLLKDAPFFDPNVNFSLNLETEVSADSDFSQLNFSGGNLPEMIVDAGIDLGEKKINARIENILSLQAGLNLNEKQAENQFKSKILFKQSSFNPLLESLGLAGVKLSIDGQIEADGRLPVKLSPGIIEVMNTVGGSVDLNARFSRDAGGPDFSARLNLADLKGEIGPDLVPGGIKLDGFTGKIEASPEKLSIESIQAKINDGGFQLSGHASMENYKISEVVLKLDASRLPLPGKVSKEMKPLEIEQLNAEFDIIVSHDKTDSPGSLKAGLLSRPIPFRQILAEIDLTNPGVQIQLDQSMTVNASIHPEPGDYQITVDFDKVLLSPYLSLAGITRIHPELNGYIKSKGKLKKPLPETVVEGLKGATGNIVVKTSLDGPVNRPAFDAQIRLRDLGYPIPQAGTAISGLNGTIRASRDRLEIQKVAASMGAGSFSLDGAINIKDFQPVEGEIRFNSRDIEVEVPDMAEVAFNSDLKFTSAGEKSDLSGTIELIKGEFYKDFTFNLTDAVGKKKRKTAEPETKSETGNPFLDRIALNIDVDYKDPFTVDNNLVFMLIEPNITVKGTAVSPVVTGRVKIIEGTVIYQKREFEIEKGIIDFVDPYKIDPDIDLVAKNQIRDWLIHLEIKGKTDNLNFKLYSEPQETHEDILSLLIAGKTTKELGQGGGSYTDVLTEKASDVIGKTVEESTPLDSFKIGYDGSQGQGSNVSVTMGKKLSRRLEVIYSTKTEDDETIHTNAAEYKLLENLMLKAFNDSKGDFGTEFKFKLEFR